MLEGKVVIITGSAGGIGRYVAKTFAQEHAKVVVCDVKPLDNVSADLEALEADYLAAQADVRDEKSVRGLMDSVMNRYGRIDVLHNNAAMVTHFQWGGPVWPRIGELDPSFWDKVIGTNLGGTFMCTRFALPHMEAQRSGHIINMASVAGLVATPTYTIYAACKFAVRGFSEALRREVAPWGIRVSVIYPGGVATEFGSHAGIKRKTKATTPAWMRLTAEDVGRAVVGLVRRPRAGLIITWPFRFSVLLNNLLPGLVDWTTINQYTKLERSDELKAAGLL